MPVAFLLLLGWTTASLLIVLSLRAHPHSRFGPANTLTAIRAAGALVLAAVALEPAELAESRAWIAGAGFILFLLDGVDGFLARRTGLDSAYGARFDIEVDAALTLALSALAFRLGVAGPEILLLVVPYYLFSLLKPAFPWLGRALRPSWRRKAVCVAQVATPILLLAAPLPETASRALALSCLAALLWSFARDIRLLAAHRR